MKAENRSISLYTYWYTWKQRPHHLVDTANNLGFSVKIYSVRSLASYARSFLRSTGSRVIEAGRHDRRYSYPIVPTRKGLLRSRIVNRLNYFSEQSALKDYSRSLSDIHIFSRMPIDIPRKKPRMLIYDCMDEWADYPGVTEKIIENEQKLCELADRIWVVSQHLFLKFSELYSGKTFYVPNGVNPNFFRCTHVTKPERDHRPRVLGYVGTLFSWFDASLVRGIARILDDWEVRLIGPIDLSRSQRKALDLPNITFLGRRPYESLPAMIAEFKVAMIPFKMSNLIKGTSPIKLFEYLAAGLPVVSTRLPEVAALEEPGILQCEEDAEKFAQAVRALASEDNQIQAERRRKIAERYSWNSIFREALDELQSPRK